MKEKVLLNTIKYLGEKTNRDAEDLRNEKKAWDQLVEMGVKEKSEIPTRLADVELIQDEGEIQNAEKMAKEKVDLEAAQKAMKDLAEKEVALNAESERLKGLATELAEERKALEAEEVRLQKWAIELAEEEAKLEEAKLEGGKSDGDKTPATSTSSKKASSKKAANS